MEGLSELSQEIQDRLKRLEDYETKRLNHLKKVKEYFKTENGKKHLSEAKKRYYKKRKESTATEPTEPVPTIMV